MEYIWLKVSRMKRWHYCLSCVIEFFTSKGLVEPAELNFSREIDAILSVISRAGCKPPFLLNYVTLTLKFRLAKVESNSGHKSGATRALVAPLRNFGFSLRQKGLFPAMQTLHSHRAKTRFYLWIIQVFYYPLDYFRDIMLLNTWLVSKVIERDETSRYLFFLVIFKRSQTAVLL